MSARTEYRRHVLLALVVQQTDRDGAGELTHFFVPRADGNWLECLKEKIYVSGSDGAVLRGLERRGLIKRTHPRDTGTMSYWYAATEDGILEFETKSRVALGLES